MPRVIVFIFAARVAVHGLPNEFIFLYIYMNEIYEKTQTLNKPCTVFSSAESRAVIVCSRARFCVDALFLFIDAGSRLFFCSQTPLSCDFFYARKLSAAPCILQFVFQCLMRLAYFSLFLTLTLLFTQYIIYLFLFFSIYALFRVIFVLHISFYAAWIYIIIHNYSS